MTPTIEADCDLRLAEALTAVIAAADGPDGRALSIDRIAENIMSVVLNDSSVDDRERDSLLHLLDAADEHCQRMGAFSPS